MKIKPYHPFRSEKAKKRYLDLYDKRAQTWPVVSESRTVDTSYGQTFMRIRGPEDAQPLVLLPSASATSLSWKPNIEALSENYRVYAVDNIYDFGRSVYTRPIKTPDDLTNWLDGLFDALELGDNIDLLGMSYGAWLTSQYALRFPDRLDKVVMISPPATLFQLPGVWAWYGLTSLLPHRYFLRNMLKWMFKDLASKEDEASRKLTDELIEDVYIGIRCFKLKMLVHPTVLSDEELQSIKAPALYLVGENEVVYPAQDAIDRIEKVAPQITAEIIPGAGHDLMIVQAELVNRKVLEFLKKPSH